MCEREREREREREGGEEDLHVCVRLFQRRDKSVSFNDRGNTFYFWLYDVRHMVMDHSDSETGNLLGHSL